MWAVKVRIGNNWREKAGFSSYKAVMDYVFSVCGSCWHVYRVNAEGKWIEEK